MEFNLCGVKLLRSNRSTASPDVSESLEVAIQCISDSFGVSLSNDEHKTQYSIQPLTLPAAFGLGLARKEQIEAALAVCRIGEICIDNNYIIIVCQCSTSSRTNTTRNRYYHYSIIEKCLQTCRFG
jgi:hypothetical protein